MTAPPEPPRPGPGETSRIGPGRPPAVAGPAGRRDIAGARSCATDASALPQVAEAGPPGGGPVRPVAFSLFAAMLATAGLPIYIHAPKFYVDSYGVGLATLGGVLAALRFVDLVQDPAFGWLIERTGCARGVAVALGAAVMAASMWGLFAMAPPVAPALWFALTLTGLFSGFSFLTIAFYAQGVARAGAMGAGGHVRLAAWRETGALTGVCVAAAAPTALAATGAPFAWFAAGFALLALAAVVAMRRAWDAPTSQRADPAPASALGVVLRDPVARRLLVLALVNAAPVAVTSTLFLFYVEGRLAAPGWEGPLLLLFFLAAAVSAPLWGRVAVRIGPRRALMRGMVLAIATFGWAATLGAGDVAAFAVICVASGAALAADMTLLPAIFAARLERIAPRAAQGFGLWSFVQKATLALAAVTLLPALGAAGYDGGGDPPAAALTTLTVLYAVVPCVLKLGALALLWTAPENGPDDRPG